MHSCTACANTSESITATDTHRAAALSTLTSTRCSPTSVSQFRGFPAQESTTPTCCTTGAFIEEIDDEQEDYVPGDDGPGDDGPDGDNPSGDNPEPHNDDNDDDDDDDDDDEGEPLNGLLGQDNARMIIFNNLSIAIDRLACSARSSNSSSSHTKVREPNTFDGVKTGSPQVLLGGPGGQGTRVEVSPDTSRA